MKRKISVKIKAEVCDARTGKVLNKPRWHKNLVMDQGLDFLALPTSMADAMTHAIVGDGTAPNSVVSIGAIFTQTGTAITSSTAFFTAEMVGAFIQYGSGQKTYITAFIDDEHVTAEDSIEISSPQEGTVWMVNQTALDNKLYSTNIYQTGSGDCQTTFTGGNQIHQKRTYIVPPKVAEYNVNEIGWGPNANNICGRVVLPITEVVAPTSFLRVTIIVTYTLSPSEPEAMPNNGTNFDTAGSRMIEWLDFSSINSDGTSNSTGVLDGMGSPHGLAKLIIEDYAQNAEIESPRTSPADLDVINLGAISWARIQTAEGNFTSKMRASFSGSITTAAQTVFGIALYNNLANSPSCPSMDRKLDVPVELPTGNFQYSGSFVVTYGREELNAPLEIVDLPMDEGSGTTLADTSGFSQTGEAVNPTWNMGKLVFNGTSSVYAQIVAANRAALGLDSDWEEQDHQLIANVNFGDTPTAGCIICSSAVDGRGESMIWNGTNLCWVNPGGSVTPIAAFSPAAFNDYQIRFLVKVSPQTVEAFVNDVSLGPPVSVGAPIAPSIGTDFWIGRPSAAFTPSFTGSIWGVKIIRL